MAKNATNHFHDIHALSQHFGMSIGWAYAQIKAGLLPPPVKFGPRCHRWPAAELDAIVRARLAGSDSNCIRELVRDLCVARSNAIEEPALA